MIHLTNALKMQNKIADETIQEEYKRKFFIENMEALTDLIGIRGGSVVLHFDDKGKIRKADQHLQKKY